MKTRYKTKPLPMAYLYQNYQCDFESGKLYRKTKHGLIEVGTDIVRQGGLKCKIKQQTYQVHRILYAMYHNHDPIGYMIDHIDNDRYNNRIGNLRAVSGTVNNYNRKLKGGVRKNHDTWQAYITLNKKFYCLGNYATREAAESRRREFDKDFFAELLTKEEHSHKAQQ